MMSQINAPIHSYKKPQTYYQVPENDISENPKLENIFYLANETRYINSGLDSERPKFNLSFFIITNIVAKAKFDWKISKGFFPRLFHGFI